MADPATRASAPASIAALAVCVIDAAVDLDPGVQAPVLADLAQRPDLGQDFRQEALPPEAGVDRHDEDDVDEVEHVLDEGERAGRVERHTRGLAEFADAAQHAMQVDCGRGFGLDHDVVGARLDEVVDQPFGLDDHQMHVEGQGGGAPHRLDDQRAHGDVRHEPPVHHIDMNPVGAARLHRLDLIGEIAEVGREDRWRDSKPVGVTSDHGVPPVFRR